MSKIKVEKDNVVLSINEEDLGQYESRGFYKVGVTKKVTSKDLEKEFSKLKKANEELTKKATEMEKEKEELVKANEELTKKVAELDKKVK